MPDLKKIHLYTALLLSTFSGASYATQWFNSPYLGVEVIQTNQNYKAQYGKDVFKKNTQDYNVFAGFNFARNFGLEAGYEFQPKRNNSVTLGVGQAFPGGNPISSGTIAMTSYIKTYHPYVGLFASTHQDCGWFGSVKYMALVGASFSKIKAQDAFTAVSPPATADYNQNKTVFLVKLAATTHFNKNVGARLSAQYRNTSAFKIHSVPAGGELRLKDTWGIGLGLVYSFL